MALSTEEKAVFLKEKFVKLISAADPHSRPVWGKMNMHQMVEHMCYSFQNANDKLQFTLQTPPEHLEKMRTFLASDKPFKENTPNKLLPDIPPAPQKSYSESIADLQSEINDFFVLFGSDPDHEIMNPFFGRLNFDLWVQLLYKHAIHHLNQFSIAIP